MLEEEVGLIASLRGYLAENIQDFSIKEIDEKCTIKKLIEGTL